MKKDKKEAKEKGLDEVQLTDEDIIKYKETMEQMKEHDEALSDDLIEEEYQNRRLKRE